MNASDFLREETRRLQEPEGVAFVLVAVDVDEHGRCGPISYITNATNKAHVAALLRRLAEGLEGQENA